MLSSSDPSKAWELLLTAPQSCLFKRLALLPAQVDDIEEELLKVPWNGNDVVPKAAMVVTMHPAGHCRVAFLSDDKAVSSGFWELTNNLYFPLAKLAMSIGSFLEENFTGKLFPRSNNSHAFAEHVCFVQLQNAIMTELLTWPGEFDSGRRLVAIRHFLIREMAGCSETTLADHTKPMAQFAAEVQVVAKMLTSTQDFMQTMSKLSLNPQISLLM
jgi:hypothetical protein